MIRCNLAILLAERDLSITKTASDTGISRTTLTSLSSNNCQGIQLDTLNKLCIYLNVSPNDIFSTLPFSIKCKSITLNDTDAVHIFDLKIILEVNVNQKSLPIFLYGTLFKNYDNINHSKEYIDKLQIPNIEIETSFSNTLNSKFEHQENSNLKYLKMMPIYFLNDLKEDILSTFCKQLQLETDNIDISFPDELVTMKTELY